MFSGIFSILDVVKAFEWMIKNNLLTVDEENELVESISFGKYSSKLEDISKVLYLSQRRTVPKCQDLL